MKETHDASINNLLKRIPENDYIEEWMNVLSEEPPSLRGLDEVSLVVFRLSKEWLALPPYIMIEIARMRQTHRIPYRKEDVLLGLVNLGGQLKLCISLHHLLQISKDSDEVKPQLHSYERMIAIQKENEQWVFPVDEVYGILSFQMNQLQNVPVTISKSATNFIKGVFNWNHQHVGWLDEELLFYQLRKRILW